jgi:hypothetical protein
MRNSFDIAGRFQRHQVARMPHALLDVFQEVLLRTESTMPGRQMRIHPIASGWL